MKMARPEHSSSITPQILEDAQAYLIDNAVRGVQRAGQPTVCANRGEEARLRTRIKLDHDCEARVDAWAGVEKEAYERYAFPSVFPR